MENLYTKDCIRSFSGRYVNVFDPQPEMFCIEDIAHALSFQPRFGGHLPVKYSVAEHSMFVADHCREYGARMQYDALMHDASEAYLIDVPRPIKNRIPAYKEIENSLMMVMADVFGFRWPMSDEVKMADESALVFEWETIMLGIPNNYTLIHDPYQVRHRFLELFNSLKSELNRIIPDYR